VLSESPVVGPLYLASGTASTLFAALEQSCPFLALDKLMRLSQKVNRICLVISSDLCAANSRMKHAIAYRLAVHNAASQMRGEGVVIFLDVHCSSHILHRIMETTFALNDLVPRMYSIAFTLGVPKTYAQVIRHLRVVLEQDLQLGFFPDTRPPVECQARTRTILQMTLLRHRATRARNDGVFDDPAYDKRLGDLASVLEDLLNGDWANPRILHFCWKPGSSA
jgi:hypothetical protein